MRHNLEANKTEQSAQVSQERQLLSLVGDIYDAATDLEKWSVFLRNATKFFAARGAHLFNLDRDNVRLTFSVGCGYEDDFEGPLMDRFEELIPEDPRALHLFQFPGKPKHDRQMFPVETMHGSAMYREVLSKVGIEYTLAFYLPIEGENYLAFGLMRDRTGEPFVQEDCEFLGELIPHLKRAVKMQKQFTILEFSNRMVLEALDQISMGIVLVDENAQVIFANSTASAYSALRDGFGMRNGRVRLSNPELHAEFLGTIHDAVTNARSGNIQPRAAFAIERTSGARPFMLIVNTLWGNQINFDLGLLDEPVAILLITDPAEPQETEPELLQRLFGFTPSEAQLVMALVLGNTLKEASAMQQISEQTARQYLKSIFSKTETHAQKDLVKLVLDTPAWARRVST